MPVNIISRTYTNQFNPSSTTNWLLGNVGDWLKLTLECEMAVEVLFGIQKTITIQNPDILILNDGTNWGDYGFAVGMDCRLFFEVWTIDNQTGNFSGGPFNNSLFFTVRSINGDTLEANSTATGGPVSNWGYQYGQIAPIRTAYEEVKNVSVISTQSFQGINIEYAHLQNSQASSGSLNNFLDGTKTVFRAEDTDLTAATEKYELNITNEVDYYLTPYQSGLNVDKVFVTYRGAAQHRKYYDIDIIFQLNPFGDITNFQDNELPDVLDGANSITDSFKISAYPVYNNPNVSVSNDVQKTVQNGNVGWFDENFNQLPNIFSFTPVVYTNAAGDTVDALDYANPITVQTTISGINNLGGASRFQYGFMWVDLEPDSYQKTEYAGHDNRKVSTGGQAEFLSDVFALGTYPPLRGGYSFDGATMDAQDINFIQNGADLDVEITFVPNAAFTTLFSAKADTERQYIIWVSVGDDAPEYNQSDRVSLLLDFSTMETAAVPVGPYDGLTIEFLDHPQAYTDTPKANNNTFVEDDLLAKVSFQEDTATGSTIPDLTSITFGFLVENSTTQEQYVLEAESVDLTQFPDPTQYNYDASRGFKLGTGNDKNWIKVDYDATNDSGTKKGVLGWYGYKIRWEDWIKRFPVPPNDFYDNTQAQNGLNNDWFHYFNTSGWNFYFYVDIAAQLDGVSVVYQNLKELILLDYDSNADVDVTFNYYRDNNGAKGTLLTAGTDPISGLPLGVIVKGEYVWLDIIYTWVGVGSPADWASQITVDANVYATSCSEVDGGAGFKEFRQLSSIWSPEFTNPLEGIPTETLAKVVQVSATEIRVECRINANKLIDAPRYKITGRIGCK